MARNVRKSKGLLNPLFVGPPGVAKSSVIQQWCAENNMPFIDLRAAYLEAPDIIGFPSITLVGDRQVTVHNPPSWLPTTGEGVLLLEEPNRGTTSVMNTFMQLLTDRKIHEYHLPEGWLIVGAINPETESYDVNVMDSALKNRFVMFEVEYDQKTFVDYMEVNKWDERLVMFVQSGIWKYVNPEKVAENTGNKYVSPRSFAQVNSVLAAGIPREMELEVFQSILGDNYGNAFYSFLYNEVPVLYENLANAKTKKKALGRLETYSNPKSYNNAQISITIKDIIKTNEISDDLLREVLLTIPADQAIVLIKELSFVRNEEKLAERIIGSSKELTEHLKSRLKD